MEEVRRAADRSIRQVRLDFRRNALWSRDHRNRARRWRLRGKQTAVHRANRGDASDLAPIRQRHRRIVRKESDQATEVSTPEIGEVAINDFIFGHASSPDGYPHKRRYSKSRVRWAWPAPRRASISRWAARSCAQ